MEKRAISGRSVHLTIDENLQYIAETELQRAVDESVSKSGIAILVRPDSGEILAMAATPTFNPNRYGDYPASHWRNRSVMDVYEPGSTFKIVAAAAALEEGVTTEDERIDCGGGLFGSLHTRSEITGSSMCLPSVKSSSFPATSA